MKLFKISKVHYVVTSDSEIKEGDEKVCFYLPEKDIVINDAYCICELENLLHITHSTLHIYNSVSKINILDINEIIESDTTLSSWDVEFVEGKLKLSKYDNKRTIHRGKEDS